MRNIFTDLYNFTIAFFTEGLAFLSKLFGFGAKSSEEAKSREAEEQKIKEQKIKQIGQQSRLQMEALFKEPIVLKTWVKVGSPDT